MESDSAGDSGARDHGAPMVFVSDASAEAGRISQRLAELGYAVADVPVALLAGRVAVQRPSLIVCDADAEGSVDALARVREPTSAARVPILVLGAPERLEKGLPEGLADAAFGRPVDTASLLETIERLIGVPEPRPSGRPSKLALSSRPPGRHSVAPRPSERVVRLDPPPAAGAIPLPPDLTGEGPPAREPGDAPVVELSHDMQAVLLEAERRFGDSKPSPQSGREDHGPEVNAEGPLPPEVLLALEEPLDDEDFAEEGQTPAPADGTGSLTASKVGVRGYTQIGGGTFATSHGTDATGPASDASAASLGGRAAGPETGVDAPAEGDGAEQDARRARQRASTPKPPKPTVEMEADAALQGDGGSRPPPTASENAIPEPPRSDHGSDRPVPTSRPGGTPPALSHVFDDPSVEERPEDDGFARRALSSTTPPVRRRDDVLEPARAQPNERPSDPRPSDRPSDPRAAAGETSLSLPSPLRAGEAAAALARAIARRYTGALAFEVDEGIRRIVLRDGDLVTVATGVHGESLVAFLASRGDLPPEVARQGHKLPAFGRRAGAALIAHGHLAQDQLWPVLRSHAEWVVGRVLEIERGSVVAEEVGRLADEPAVFGGATGAEVLVEVVRRVVTPEEALGRLGGLDAELGSGPSLSLLGECALAPAEAERVQHAAGSTVRDLVDASPDPSICSTLYALVCLGVLSTAGVRPKAPPERQKPVRDEIDDTALRGRIMARKALVDEGDYFAVLGVSRDATGYDIRRAFTTLRRELEPSHVLTSRTADLVDVVTEILSVIEEAYQILSDQRRRERYRRAIEAVP